MFTKEDMALMSPPEVAAAKEINAAAEAGEDVLGDGVAVEAVAETPPADEPAAEAAADETSATETTDETDETDETTDEAPASFVPELRGEAPADYTTKKAELRSERADLHKQWSAGEIEDDAYNEQLVAIEDRIEELQSAHVRAEALNEANRQIQAQRQADVLQGIAKDAKKAGIDYTDDGMAAMFDAKLRATLADAAMKGKAFADVAAEAHARVLKAIGKDKPAPAATTTTERPKPPAAPVTLKSLPVAERPNTGDDLVEQWKHLEGHKAEAFFAKLTPAQQDRLLAA